MSLFIAGAGGFARETLDALLACGRVVEAFLDDPMAGQTVRGLEVRPLDAGPADAEFIAGVADPVLRSTLVEALAARGMRPVSVVHPRAVIGPETMVGPGCVVLANAHVSSSVRLGSHVQVNYNATIGHDAVLDDYVTVLPGANVSGSVHLGEGVRVGSNSCVLQGLRVGRGTFVGAGAVVTKDLGEHLTVAGVPARIRPESS